jgi:hypothetical protein
MKKISIQIIVFSAGLSVWGCRKIIAIPPPQGQLTTSQVFESDAQALSAASGIYYNMINAGGARIYSNAVISLFTGMSADELAPFDKTSASLYIQFYDNTLNADNSYITYNLWSSIYSTIYAANALLEGLDNSSDIHAQVKKELSGEARFIRAFCNFYLVNLFGDAPLVTTVNWHKTNLLSRTASPEIYGAIIADLKEAAESMAADYAAGKGQRIIPNKWAATALLAKVNLYLGNWKEADSAASSVISQTSLFSLANNPNEVFLVNSPEAIWQLQQTNSGDIGSYNATPEGYLLIPPDATVPPFLYLTEDLLNAFEQGDQRKTCWIDSTTYGDSQYYFPYKYKIGPAQATINGPYKEYYMVLRLAEQFLIRAEARAHLDNLAGATDDINTIRNRSGLPDLGILNQDQLLEAIAHERQVELFSEWGNRWMDLNRTGQSDQVLGTIKPSWTAKAKLYPIPTSELQTDPNLTQNIGY